MFGVRSLGSKFWSSSGLLHLGSKHMLTSPTLDLPHPKLYPYRQDKSVHKKRPLRTNNHERGAGFRKVQGPPWGSRGFGGVQKGRDQGSGGGPRASGQLGQGGPKCSFIYIYIYIYMFTYVYIL